MNDRPVIAYDRTPDVHGTAAGDDTPVLNVTARPSIWPLVFALALFTIAAITVWNEWSPRRSVVDHITNLLPLVFPLCVFIIGLMHGGFPVRRSTLRPHAGGFVLEQAGWLRRQVLDVAWHEVGDVTVVSGPKPAFGKRPCWLRIDLLNTLPDEVVPLDLMRGRPADEVFRTAAVLERWWQNAATNQRPPE